MKYRLLVADDDSLYLSDMIKLSLDELPDFEVDPAPTPDQCRKMIKEKAYDVILLDIRFSTHPDDEEGLKLIPEIKKLSPKTEIIVHSSHNSNAMIAKTKALGAHLFLIKDYYSLETLALKVRTFLPKKLNREEDLDAGMALASYVGAVFKSNAMKNVFKEAAKARQCLGLNVLITGPSGAGKELVANGIGQGIKDHPFVAVNCANFTEDLVQSALFGHERGAFTGAHTKAFGKFDLANGGTLFLDEVACLNAKAQENLLRAIQLGEFMRVGGNEIIRVKVRVIAATNENLLEMVKKGKFRLDLYQRLAGIKIEIPPLHERPEDIPLLIEFFIKNSPRPHVAVDPTLVKFLTDHSWPGNVRELGSAIEYMVKTVKRDELDVGDIPLELAIAGGSQSVVKNRASETSGIFNFSCSFGISFEEMERLCAIQYITETEKRLGYAVTKRELADALLMAKTSLLRRMNECEIPKEE